MRERKPQKPPNGYEALLLKAGAYDVMIKTRVKRELLKRASEDQRTELDDLVRRYAKEGPKGLPAKKFNANEGWFPSSKAKGKVRLEAIKAWKLRAYGFCRTFDGRPTFFITGVDPVKKQDEADQAIVSAAGKEAFGLSELLDDGEKNVAVQKPR